MVLSSDKTVLFVATLSRLAIFVISFLAPRLGGVYDRSAAVLLDSSVELPLLSHWDGNFNLRVATAGYEFIEFHMAFPLLPMLVRMLAAPFGGGLAAMQGAAFFVSNCSFVAAAWLLYRLGQRTLCDRVLAERAALLFCVAPSSVFFSAFYTESLFAALSFSGMLLTWDVSLRSRFAGVLLWMLAASTRSNGVVPSVIHICCSGLWRFRGGFGGAAKVLVECTFFCFLCTLPSTSVLWYGYRRFCPSAIQPSPEDEWCQSTIPNVYAHIQAKYWNVGLFRFYSVEQAPNFALALPCAIFSVKTIVGFASEGDLNQGLHKSAHALHVAVLLTVCILTMHVQVLTRFVSACPAVFWCAARMTKRDCSSRSATLVFFLGYALLGTAMFSSYLPWT